MNSNQKGKRGEREWRDVLREHGYTARRGQQFAGGEDSPDAKSIATLWHTPKALPTKSSIEQTTLDNLWNK